MLSESGGIFRERYTENVHAMNKVERTKRIREILMELGQADVVSLSGSLGVSGATIRSDLMELEREGFLTRYHGGATLNTPEESQRPVSFLDTLTYSPDTEQVGVIAAQLVQNHEGVFLGPGTTCYYIARALRNRPDIKVNVVTNNFLVASAVRGCSWIRLHMIGGLAEPDGLFTMPEDIDQSLSGIFLDKFFFSIDGIELDAGYTLSDSSVHNIITTVAERSRLTVMAAEAGKFGKCSFMKIGDLSFAPVVVSNPSIPTEYRNYYESHGICLYTSTEKPSEATAV